MFIWFSLQASGAFYTWLGCSLSLFWGLWGEIDSKKQRLPCLVIAGWTYTFCDVDILVSDNILAGVLNTWTPYACLLLTNSLWGFYLCDCEDNCCCIIFSSVHFSWLFRGRTLLIKGKVLHSEPVKGDHSTQKCIKYYIVVLSLC